MIRIDVSKESNFDAYSKYAKFIKFKVTIKSYESEKIYLIFEKAENTPKTSSDLNENDTIKLGIPENRTVDVSSSYVQKCGTLQFFCQKRDHGCEFICLFFVLFSP